MKKAYFLLLIATVISIMTGCSNNDSLSQSLEHGDRVSQKIQKLYDKKSQELGENADRFFVWRKQIPNTNVDTLYTIEKSKEGNWGYYTKDYQRISLEWKDKILEGLVSTLFNDYEVERILIDNNDIRFYISEDALIYSKIKIEEDVRTDYIEGNWYHFIFPYGI